MIFGGICLYLLPAIIANYRKHREKNAIFMINLILGWTFLGWAVALVWSFTSNVDKLKPATA